MSLVSLVLASFNSVMESFDFGREKVETCLNIRESLFWVANNHLVFQLPT